jgi:hypothetical protein
MTLSATPSFLAAAIFLAAARLLAGSPAPLPQDPVSGFRFSLASRGSLSTLAGYAYPWGDLAWRLEAETSGLAPRAGISLHGPGEGLLVAGPLKPGGLLSAALDPLCYGTTSLHAPPLALDGSLEAPRLGFGLTTPFLSLFAFGSGGALLSAASPDFTFFPDEAADPLDPPEAKGREAIVGGLACRGAAGGLGFGCLAGLGYLREGEEAEGWKEGWMPGGPWLDPLVGLFLVTEEGLPRLALSCLLSNHEYAGYGGAWRFEAGNSWRNLSVQVEAMAVSTSFRGWKGGAASRLGRGAIDGKLAFSVMDVGLRLSLEAGSAEGGLLYKRGLGLRGAARPRPGLWILPSLRVDIEKEGMLNLLSSSLTLEGGEKLSGWKCFLEGSLSDEEGRLAGRSWLEGFRDPVFPATKGRIAAGLGLPGFGLSPGFVLGLEMKGALDLIFPLRAGLGPELEMELGGRLLLELPSSWRLSLFLGAKGLRSPGFGAAFSSGPVEAELLLERRWPPPRT